MAGTSREVAAQPDHRDDFTEDLAVDLFPPAGFSIEAEDGPDEEEDYRHPTLHQVLQFLSDQATEEESQQVMALMQRRYPAPDRPRTRNHRVQATPTTRDAGVQAQVLPCLTRHPQGGVSLDTEDFHLELRGPVVWRDPPVH